MATRTSTTRTTRAECCPSAGADTRAPAHADFSFAELVAAYLDCRRHKRNTASALEFEARLEHNLIELDEDLRAGTYTPGPSICFVVTSPKPREVWAAAFRDRVVHHLVYNRIAARFHARFIAASCACIPGRGTLYAGRTLESMVRSATQNWSRPCMYLKADLANFFVSIDKTILGQLLAAEIHEPWWRALTLQILHYDPRPHADVRGDPRRLALIPPHKSLFNQPADRGLPIGNLSSQFFANVYLNELDQFAKHCIGARHYIRYVDDFVVLHPDAAWLNRALAEIAAFLPAHLRVALNPAKTIIQPVDRGIDFVGHVIKPWRRTTRPRTFRSALHRLASVPAGELHASANSTFGLLRQASHSHHDRAMLARLLRRRGFAVDRNFTKTYRRTDA
ncbi:MAG: RNA-directed DNA polymerase [Betaproteobacteria bacterium]|nr:RNA-directed DNA polymerase [Betaproteobacteria bacterium]